MGLSKWPIPLLLRRTVLHGGSSILPRPVYTGLHLYNAGRATKILGYRRWNRLMSDTAQLNLKQDGKATSESAEP